MLDNNPPPESRAANRHGRPGPNRTTAARVATPTASTVFATGEPEGDGGSLPGANTSAHRTNNTAISAARAPKRRNQPRTVEAGTPNVFAIDR